MPQALPKHFLYIISFSIVLAGCGAGSSTTPPPAIPAFSSTPPMAAVEGTPYSYQLAATSSDMSAITFALTTGPAGATLSGNTLSWTPAHQQSRTANAFTVTATTAKGGSATQSWSVSPNGTIQIKAVFTYWTPTGKVDVPRGWLAGQPYPAALVPQTDGSLTRLPGAVNSDGTVSIADVPAGFYWLQLSQVQTYWTSSSDFDAGADIVGSQLKTTTQSTTTINISLSGLDPIQAGDAFPVQSNARGFELGILGAGFPGTTTVNLGERISSNIDFSSINTLFFNQLEPVTSGTFSGVALGPALTQSNVAITNGGVNNITAALLPSPKQSIPLNIKGSAWANNYQNIAPASVTPLLTDFSVSAQPFVTDRIANALTTFIGPNLTMLTPRAPSTTGFTLTGYLCGESSGPLLFPPLPSPLPPILTDQDFGTISYGDPFPATWPRMFQICQHATVQIPRPNSAVTDTFLLTFGETTAIPTAPIAPLVGPVQNPMINGSSIFQSATLNSTNVNLSWTAPAGAQPFGYFVTIFQLATLSTGTTQYVTAGRFGTAKTSMSVPLLNAGSSYLFQIVAAVDGVANMETSPLRSQLPIAHSTVISAPITVN
jgi:hypothetical protein